MLRTLALAVALFTYIGPAHTEGVWRIWLDSSRINDLAADDAGYVWCATWGGVVRWNPDGSYVKYTTLDGLPYNIADAVTVDASGAVLVGCRSGGGAPGIARFEAGRWRTYTDIPVHEHGLASDGRGTLWVAVGTSVYSFDGTESRKWQLGEGYGILVTGAIAVDGSGKVWIGTIKGAMCFDGAVWKTYTKEDGLSDNCVDSIAVDRDGVLWFGTLSGITSYDGTVWKTWRWELYTDPAYQYPGRLGNSVLDIAVDRNNVKWFATVSGLARFDVASWTTWTPEGGGLLHKMIGSLAVDAANRLWIAYYTSTSHPRAITRFDGVEWRHFSTDGPVGNDVHGIGIDRGGVKWFNTLGNSGMSMFDGTTWRAVLPPGVSKYHYEFVDFTVGSDGVRWFAVPPISFETPPGGGVWRFDGEEWQTFTAENSGLASNYVSAVEVDRAGVLWCVTQAGISSFNGAVWKTYTEPGAPEQASVSCIVVDHEDIKWFVTNKGVFRFDGASWTSFGDEPLIGDVRVLSAAVDSRNVKWFVVAEAGLVRFDGERWTHLTVENIGQKDVFVRKVAVDRRDVLWITCGQAHEVVLRYDGASWEIYKPFKSSVTDIAVDERNVKWFTTCGNGIFSFDDGPSDGSTVVNESSALPAVVRVLGNSPNPFNAATVIRFALPHAVRAELVVFDVTGRKVRTLVSDPLPAGTCEVRWDGRDDSGRPVSSGVYLSRLRAGNVTATGRMLFLK